jgi:hypothetical protein
MNAVVRGMSLDRQSMAVRIATKCDTTCQEACLLSHAAQVHIVVCNHQQRLVAVIRPLRRCTARVRAARCCQPWNRRPICNRGQHFCHLCPCLLPPRLNAIAYDLRMIRLDMEICL